MGRKTLVKNFGSLRRNGIVLGAVFAGLVILAGCDQDTASGPIAQNPATQPAPVSTAVPPQSELNTTIAVTPPATRPAVSLIYIDRIREIFPPSKLRLSVSDGKVLAELFSDDPSEVLAGKELTNSYDFAMTLSDITSTAELDKALWISQSSSSSRVDTPYGIILPEAKEVLQPMDAAVRFVRKGDRVQVIIEGKFWMFSNDNHIQTPGEIVNVMASLDASVVGG